MNTFIEALAWTGFVLLYVSTVYQALKGTVEMSKQHGMVGLVMYLLFLSYFTWCCFHLLRFA